MGEGIEARGRGEVVDFELVEREVADPEQREEARNERLLRERIEGVDQATDDEHADRERREQPLHPAQEEVPAQPAERRRAKRQQRGGDHEARDDEEDIHPQETLGDGSFGQVIGDDRQDRERPQPVDVRAIVGFRQGGSITTSIVAGHERS